MAQMMVWDCSHEFCITTDGTKPRRRLLYPRIRAGSGPAGGWPETELAIVYQSSHKGELLPQRRGEPGRDRAHPDLTEGGLLGANALPQGDRRLRCPCGQVRSARRGRGPGQECLGELAT